MFRQRKHVQNPADQTNRLLAAFEPESRGRIEAHLQPVEFKLGHIVCHAGGVLDHAYFPMGAVFSLLTVLRSGAAIETANIGAEGAFGLFAAMYGRISFNQCIVGMEGKAARVPIEVLRTEFARSEQVRNLIISYSETLLAQVQQTVACNTVHTVHERLCRWLLTMHDHAGCDDLSYTHEFVAGMLGVDRKSVTLAAQALQMAGLISYTRGTIRIRDRPGLEAAACECHSIIQERCTVFPRTPQQPPAAAGQPKAS